MGKDIPTMWFGNKSQVSAPPTLAGDVGGGRIAPIKSPPIDTLRKGITAVKAYNIPLTNAQTNFALNLGGNTIWYKASTNTTDFITILFDNPTNDPITMFPGDAIEDFPFTNIFISNNAIPGATATLAVFANPKTVVVNK